MKRLLAILFFLMIPSLAIAQSAPGVIQGQIPSASQWNGYFSAKQDYYPGGIPISAGGTSANSPTGAVANFYLQGLTRTQISSSHLGTNRTITLYGYNSIGDSGFGAVYSSIGATGVCNGNAQDADGINFCPVTSYTSAGATTAPPDLCVNTSGVPTTTGCLVQTPYTDTLHLFNTNVGVQAALNINLTGSFYNTSIGWDAGGSNGWNQGSGCVVTYCYTGDTGQPGWSRPAPGGTGLNQPESTFIGPFSGTQATSGGGFNTGLGVGTLSHETTGDHNIAVGGDAMRDTDQSVQNIAIGVHALNDCFTCTGNVFVGFEAGQGVVGSTGPDLSPTTGADNTGIGRFAMQNWTTASNNVAIGRSAGAAMTTTANSVLVGWSAGASLAATTAGFSGTISSTNLTVSGVTGTITIGQTLSGAGVTANTVIVSGSGTSWVVNNSQSVGPEAMTSTILDSDNTCIGYTACENHDLGLANTAVGYQAMQNAACSTSCPAGNVAIGNSGLSIVTGSNNIAIGQTPGQALTSGGDDIFIGRATGAAETNLSGIIFIGATAGLASTGSFDTGIGFGALAANDTGSNTAVGYDALNVNTGSDNVAMGLKAGFALTGSNDVFIGWEAGFATVSGANSVAIGAGALGAASTGGNVAIGFDALLAATGANNVAIGANAGKALVNVNGNVIVGAGAGILVTGATNSLFGQNAGSLLAAAASNTIIGANVATTTLTTGSNNLLIGHSSAVDTPASNTASYIDIENTIFGFDAGSATTPGVTVALQKFTVSTLPTCGSGLYVAGTYAYVTDATAPSYNGTLTGGGAVKVPVMCDGTTWHSS